MKNKKISIYIDADASPVVNEILNMREDLDLSVILVHSRAHIRSSGLPDDVQVIMVESGPDAADYEIVRRAGKGDIAVTEDLGLSSILLAKGVRVINAGGKIIRQEEIDSLLEVRHASQKARRSGKRTRGPKKRTREDGELFQQKLRDLVKLSS